MLVGGLAVGWLVMSIQALDFDQIDCCDAMFSGGGG